ncbi:hypothetical protein BT63DRAFT_376868 [Microthyrium microscopicum]|uniref:Gylcosyl hydrolase 115 C-terminal domain-containing protein n=1 Tax=Microthyrium microscopicum TaxID=703497 RepID=A0A6A6U4P0_9PEZI|nr:hypothetical protein BT63DRAFT_376868 [Microthyrium microscopicum]
MRTFGILLLLARTISVLGLGQTPVIAFEPSSGSLRLADSSTPVQILVEESDWKGVIRTANDLAHDFGRVTGLNGTVLHSNATTKSPGVIIAGTIGKSALVDRLLFTLNTTTAIRGQWETYLTTIVQSPLPGIPSALLIAGSDKRGTIFGLYSISEQIGVSPWHFWADVPTKRHSAIYTVPRTNTINGPPSIKYRGIFLNDEAPALSGWVRAKYGTLPNGAAAMNADFYATIFELLLRLRANLLYPAMWDGQFAVDDKRSQARADEYGIVMGTSHTEPMARSTKEWNVRGAGAWNWKSNRARVEPFLKEGAERAKPYETLFTIGMRGSHDTPMSADVETSVLEEIVASERAILKDLNMTGVPQSWCLYKEVQGYYEAGMRVPDDVVLLWADDNWGNIRRLPNAKDNNRTGGAGVYYHFDYVGDPRNYKWINTVILQKTWHQIHLAHAKNARDIWVVNVGDLKPLEIPINHVLDMAYDINRWEADPVPWLTAWADREFGTDEAKDIARIAARFSVLAGQRKFELVEPDTWSVSHYDEADRVMASWKELVDESSEVYKSVQESAKATYFQTIHHPIVAGENFHKTMILAGKNRLHALQGRNYANWLADEVRKAFGRDHILSKQYNELLNGKWSHMMDQTHFGYSSWQQPMRQYTPPLHYVQTLEPGLNGNIRVMAEGSPAVGPMPDDGANNDPKILPQLSPYSQSRRWIEVFSTAIADVSYEIKAEPFVKLSERSGELPVNGEGSSVKVFVDIDWSKLSKTSGNTTITIIGTVDGKNDTTTVHLPYNSAQAPSGTKGAIEADGYISYEPWKLPELLQAKDVEEAASPRYLGISEYGVTLAPSAISTLTEKSAPILSIPFFSFTTYSNSSITVYFAPSLNTDPDNPMAYTVAVDGQTPKRVQIVKDGVKGDLPAGWDKAVTMERWESKNMIPIQPGQHTLKLQLLDAGLVLKKIVVDFGGVKSTGLGPPESKWIA